MIVLPAAGLLIRDPVTKQHLPVDVGTDVPENAYWMRRLRCGDVVLVVPPTSPIPDSAEG